MGCNYRHPFDTLSFIDTSTRRGGTPARDRALPAVVKGGTSATPTFHHPEFSHLVDHDMTVIGPPTDRGALPYFTEELVFVNLLPPELLCLLRVYTLHA